MCLKPGHRRYLLDVPCMREGCTYRRSLSGSWPARNQACTRRRRCPVGPPCRCGYSRDPCSCSSGLLQDSSMQQVTSHRQKPQSPNHDPRVVARVGGLAHNTVCLNLWQPQFEKNVIKIKLGQLTEICFLKLCKRSNSNLLEDARALITSWSSVLGVQTP